MSPESILLRLEPVRVQGSYADLAISSGSQGGKRVGHGHCSLIFKELEEKGKGCGRQVLRFTLWLELPKVG